MSPLFPLAYLALHVESAYALETGNIQGIVEDETGVPVPGAEVVLSGADLAGERKATTPEDGSFRFDGLSSGTYEVTVLFKGATIARAEIRVAMNTTTTARIPAKMGGISEEVEVVGFKPVIDTSSSSFSTSLGEDSIQNLPVGRSFASVVNTIPGVSGRVDTQNGGAGGSPSVRGEGGYGNNYFIDGVSTRDPATKRSGANVNFDAIQEIQVYTDAAPAEFGQFTGMMVNVVTKDGGDEHHGSAAVFYSQHAWFEKEYDIYDPETGKESPTRKATFRTPRMDLTAGGPIIKEKLWYFGALGLSYSVDRPEGLDEKADPLKTTSGDLLAKVTWFPSSAWTLRYIFSGQYSNALDWDAGPLVAPEATTNNRSLLQSHRVTATLAPDDLNTLELRLGYINNNIDVVPTLGDPTVPSRVDLSGVLHDNANDTDLNDRNRYGASIEYSRFLDNLLGDHRFKTGADFWILQELRDIQNSGDTTVEWIDSTGNPIPGDNRAVGTQYKGGTLDVDGDGVDEVFECANADGNYSDCLYKEQWVNVGPLGNTIRTYSAFLQDDWAPINRLTLNLGVRIDVEDGRNGEECEPDVEYGSNFPKGKGCDRPITQNPQDLTVPPDQRPPPGRLTNRFMPAPRLGFALDPFDDGKMKVSGFYGSFYDITGNNFYQWSNTQSANGFLRFRNDGAGNFVWNNTQDPVGNPLIYAEDLLPARMEKANIAIEREIVKNLSVGLRGIISRTKNLPEDIDTNFNDWYIMNSPEKERFYRGVELTANKWFDEVWQLYGAVTLQESYGTNPGQFELASGADSGSDGNNVGVYLDDIGQQDIRQDYYEGGPNCAGSGLYWNAYHGCSWVLDALQGLGHYSPTDEKYYDQAGWYGYLPYHSFVSIKLNGSYTAPFGTTFGLVYEFDSGHAWEKKTLVGFYGYDGFGQGRGSRFMPAVHYVDGRIAHTIGLGKEDRELEATLDVFNIPGFAQSITYWTNDEDGFGSTLNRQAPRSVRLGLKMRY